MASSEWRYSQAGQVMGPVSTEQLRALISAGTVPLTELAWKEGMSDWAPISSLPVLLAPSSAAPFATPPSSATAPAAAHAAGPIPAAEPATAIPIAVPYHTSSDAAMPHRAAEALRGHARPSGDVGDWPLDDPRVAQFQHAVKLRRKINGAAQLYQLLLVLSVIPCVILLIVGLFTMGAGVGRMRAGDAIAMLVAVGVTAAMSILYLFTWRATKRSHRWAPLTMLIVFLFFLALNLLSIAVALTGRQPEAAIGGLASLLFLAAFAWVSGRAFVAIPEYLRHPAWCQELIARAGM